MNIDRMIDVTLAAQALARCPHAFAGTDERRECGSCGAVSADGQSWQLPPLVRAVVDAIPAEEG